MEGIEVELPLGNTGDGGVLIKGSVIEDSMSSRMVGNISWSPSVSSMSSKGGSSSLLSNFYLGFSRNGGFLSIFQICFPILK